MIAAVGEVEGVHGQVWDIVRHDDGDAVAAGRDARIRSQGQVITEGRAGDRRDDDRHAVVVVLRHRIAPDEHRCADTEDDAGVFSDGRNTDAAGVGPGRHIRRPVGACDRHRRARFSGGRVAVAAPSVLGRPKAVRRTAARPRIAGRHDSMFQQIEFAQELAGTRISGRPVLPAQGSEEGIESPAVHGSASRRILVKNELIMRQRSMARYSSPRRNCERDSDGMGTARRGRDDKAGERMPSGVRTRVSRPRIYSRSFSVASELSDDFRDSRSSSRRGGVSLGPNRRSGRRRRLPTRLCQCRKSDRSAQVLRNLSGLFSHGRLAGTGYLSILPVDQRIEHSAGAGASVRQ